MELTIGSLIYWRGSRKGFASPTLQAGRIVSQAGKLLTIQVRYQVGVLGGKPKLFTENRANLEWNAKVWVGTLDGNLFESEEELHAAIKSDYGVDFQTLLDAAPNALRPETPGMSLDDFLPVIPRNASIDTVVSLIKEARALYHTNRFVSNEAIAIALMSRTNNQSRKQLFDQARHYFRRGLLGNDAI